MSTSPVLLVSNHSQIVGGGEISLLTLIKGLKDADWEPLLFVPAEGEVAERARALAVDVHIAPLPPIRNLRALISAVRAARRQVRTLEPRIIHANGSRAMFYAALAARATGCPTVWHIRILDPDPKSDRLLARWATASIAISSAVRERLRPWPRAYENCRIIPNGLDLRTFVPRLTRDEARAALGFGDDAFLVTTVGRLVDFKGHTILLNAMAMARRKIPELKCLIVGDGPEKPKLLERAAQEDLAGVVEFLGHRDDIPDVLAASDAFVLPSPAESFGRVLIEAMAASLPAVAFDAAGPAEILENGSTGLLVEPGSADELAQAVARLHAAPELRELLGTAARRRVEERYSMEGHAKHVIGLYRELLRSDH